MALWCVVLVLSLGQSDVWCYEGSVLSGNTFTVSRKKILKEVG